MVGFIWGMTNLHFCKPIPGYDGYFVSNIGAVFSRKSGRSKQMSIRESISGYITVVIQTKQYQMHRLVAAAWLPNFENAPLVNHIDGDKKNNRVENLEYVTYKQNSHHARNVLKTVPHQKAVCQVSLDGKLIKEFKSIVEADEATGISRKSICLVCQGKRRKAGEFVWCYKKDFKGEGIRRLAQCKPIYQCDLQWYIIKRFESAKEAAEEVGALTSNITNACKGRLQTCKGYKWEYVIEDEIVDETKDWITLDDYPLYKISPDGRIFSTWTKKMKLNLDRGGYKIVSITDPRGKERKIFVHRLVARAYIPNPNLYPIINHKDGNPSNNAVENLEWCTYAQNSQHAHDTGLNTTRKAVLKLDSDGNVLARYESVRSAAKSIGLTPEAVSHVCRGKNKTAGGYYWKLA